MEKAFISLSLTLFCVSVFAIKPEAELSRGDQRLPEKSSCHIFVTFLSHFWKPLKFGGVDTLKKSLVFLQICRLTGWFCKLALFNPAFFLCPVSKNPWLLAAFLFFGHFHTLTVCYVLCFCEISEIDKIRLISALCPITSFSASVCSCFRLGGERSILLSYRRIEYILVNSRSKVNMRGGIWQKKHICLHNRA